MNLKFTCSGFLPIRISLLILMALSSLVSFSQQAIKNDFERSDAGRNARIAAKMKKEISGRNPSAQPASAIDDMGTTLYQNRMAGINEPVTEAICANFSGSITAADPAFTSGRLSRNAVASSCAVPKICPGNFSAGSSFRYKTHTFTNPLAFPQCITVTHQNNGASGLPHLSIHNGPFSTANICTNYLADFGASPNIGNSVTFSFTLPASATITLLITETAVGGLGSYNITLDGCQAACSGTPSPGNTISTVSSVCIGVNFTLSLQNATAGAGITYQWEQATAAAGPWTAIAGATNATLVTNQAAATWYRCVVTCGAAGGGAGTSNPLQVTMNPPLSCYCTPPVSDCTDDDVILRVRLSTLDNSSTCGTGPPAGYTNYSTTVAAPVVYAGAANPITINVPTTFTEQLAVWIDYNQNGVFEASEYTNLGSSAGLNGVVTGNINIPASVTPIVTRMRVRVRFATALGSGDACVAYTFGETEDYNVNIQPCIPVTVTGNPSNATIVCGGNASFSVVTAGSIPSYRWEYRSNAAAAWQFVPNAAPYSGILTSTLTISNASQAYNGYQYRCVVQGGCSASDFSGSATLTVNQLVPIVNPASATICAGSIQQLTLTNTTGNTDLINEGFSVVSPLPAGWAAQNNSTPVGTTGWFQGAAATFPAQSGPANSYIAANFNNVAGDNTISNWLITPAVPIKNGDVFKFWSRTVSGSIFPDRLEVRMNTTSTTNVGATNATVGDFTNLLLTINPGLTATGYPDVWTEYTLTISGLVAPTPAGRFAFRYFVTNGGPNGDNSNYIGIDNVSFTSPGGPAQGTWTGPAGTMWTDAAATTPYTGTLANTIWVTPAVSSAYSVSYSTLTPCTSATTNVPVNVVNPAVLATSPVNRTVCDGGSTTFTATATGGPLTYQWQRSVDGGLTYTNISGATSSTLSVSGITLSMTGYRYRCVISAAPCAGSVTSAAAILTVNALPVVTLSSPDLLLIPGQTPTSITASSTPAAAPGGWVWNYNGTNIAGNNTNTVSGITIDQVGTYHATVTDVNGCSATSADIVIGSEASDRLWIYPNPTTGAFQVRLYYDPSGITERRAVYIYNSQGHLMTSREFDLANTTAPYMRMDFNLGKAAAGTYIVKVVHKYSGKVVSGLVVVQ